MVDKWATIHAADRPAAQRTRRLGRQLMILHGKRVGLPSEPLVHVQVARHAKATPDAVAVVCAGQRVTYAELNARANQFAHFLTARGCGRGAKVGICLDYSTDLIIAILGTLKSGAAYVPLDPSYPAGRLELMLGQVPGLALIVASPATVELVKPVDVDVVHLETLDYQVEPYPVTDPDIRITGDDLCYAVFTSGSTGMPKVAAVRHEGWFNLLNWLRLEYNLDNTSNNLVVSAFGFDLSQRSLMMPLFCGATQFLMPTRNFDAAMAYRMLVEHEICVVHCATSALYLLVDWERARRGRALAKLHYVLFGGEPLAIDRIASWALDEDNTCTLLHQYGVAECTDVATSYDLADYWRDGHDRIPVGRPAYNTDIHILDEQLQGVGTEEHGEICISGLSVGAGYLNGKGPESERFMTVLQDGGTPRHLYRTGDRGYVTQTGELIVLGRMDAQVKVRGMRIDPTDVERALRKLPGVRESAVVPRYADSGEAELIAFVVPAGDDLNDNNMRTGLLKILPPNMIPAKLVNVTELPLSPHGKVDRKALVEGLRLPRADSGAQP